VFESHPLLRPEWRFLRLAAAHAAQNGGFFLKIMAALPGTPILPDEGEKGPFKGDQDEGDKGDGEPWA